MAATVKVNPIRRIYDILRNERRDIWAIYIYAIMNGLVALSLPLGIQAIVSFLLAGTISVSLVLLIVLVVIGVAITGLLQVNGQKIIEKIQQQLFVRYAFEYAHVIPRLDLRASEGYYLPELVNRFFDTVTLQKGISKLLLDIPAATIQILFGLVLLSFYNPLFILFGILLLVLLYIILRITGNRGLDTSREESDYKYRVAGFLEEMARAVVSFKFSRRAALHLRRTDSDVTRYLNARTAHFRILLTQYWTLVAFKVLITAGMLIMGSVLLIQQKLNIGQFIAAELVVLTVIASIEKLITSLDTVYDVLTSVEKVSKVTDKAQDAGGSLPLPGTGAGIAVEARGLSYSYAGGEQVLKGIDFIAAPGSKNCIVGDAASGKSTLLRVLSGAYQPYEGVLTIDGLPLKQYDLEELRDGIGVLFSQQDIFEGTIWENVTMGDEAISQQHVVRLTEIVGLKPFIEGLQDGLQARVHAGGIHLSARTIRKILLVRVLAQPARLLLLEQPWLHLGTEEAIAVKRYLIHEIPGTTVFVTGPGDDFAKACDNTIRLSNGTTTSQENNNA